MDAVIGFFSTPQGVAVSSLFTIGSFIFAVFQKSKVIKLSSEVEEKDLTIEKLEIKNTKINKKLSIVSKTNSDLVIKVNNLQNGDLTNRENPVSQAGKNNINNGDISGDVTLNLS